MYHKTRVIKYVVMLKMPFTPLTIPRAPEGVFQQTRFKNKAYDKGNMCPPAFVVM
jgi:hypothetical protein